jgi:hypothetical protein
MPRKLVKVKDHLFGVDDKTGKYFSVEVKDVPFKAVTEDEMAALIEGISNGTAIIWEDPPEDKR